MQVRELLMNRKNEIHAEIEKLQSELAEIDRMLSLSGASHPQGSVPGATVAEGDKMSKQDIAVLDAVKAGNNKPADVAQYIRDNLGVSVNDASIRTRLSRMKSAGKIEHDGFGWKAK